VKSAFRSFLIRFSSQGTIADINRLVIEAGLQDAVGSERSGRLQSPSKGSTV